MAADNTSVEGAHEIYTLHELQQLAVNKLLRDRGLDAAAFLRENDVEFGAAFRPDVGVSVYITRVTKKPASAPVQESR